LSNVLSQVVKETVPKTDETTLTDCRQCLFKCEKFELNFAVSSSKTHLQLSEMLWSFLDVHASETNADGPRGNDDYLVSILSQLHCRVDDESENRQQRLMCHFVND
jgi:hypothetical protein